MIHFIQIQSCHDRMIHFESQHISVAIYVKHTKSIKVIKESVNKSLTRNIKDHQKKTKDTNEMVKTTALLRCQNGAVELQSETQPSRLRRWS